MATSAAAVGPKNENAPAGGNRRGDIRNSSAHENTASRGVLQLRAQAFRIEARELTGASEHAALSLAAHYSGWGLS